MAGAPSQLDLFDHKPKLQKYDGQEIPAEFIPRASGSRSSRARRSCSARRSRSRSTASSGAELSELLPHLATVADDIAIVRSLHTTQFNHAPGQIFMNTGSQLFGRPSMGSWLTYGLGSESRDLPGFVVLLSGENAPDGGKSCWGSGFLPTRHQGVQFRSKGDPVLYVSNPTASTAARGANRSICVTDLNRAAPHRSRRSGDRHAHRAVRDGVPDADQRAGADRHLERAGDDPRDVRHRAGQGVVRQQLPARAPAGRARRAVRAALPPRAGTPTAPASATDIATKVPELCLRDRSAPRRARQGPQAARPARRHAGRSGAASSAARR